MIDGLHQGLLDSRVCIWGFDRVYLRGYIQDERTESPDPFEVDRTHKLNQGSCKSKTVQCLGFRVSAGCCGGEVPIVANHNNKHKVRRIGVWASR